MAMVAIDDRTRIASSRRQAEAREWCLRVRRRGICVSLAGFHTGRDRAARPGTPRRRPDVSLRHLGSTFRLVATMATMATPRGPTSKKKSHAGYPLVGYHPLQLSLAFFFQGSI